MLSEINKKTNENLETLRNQIEQGLKKNKEVELDEPAGFQQEGVIFGDAPPKLKSSEYLRSALGWVYASVSAIADNVAKVQYKLYKVEKNGDVAEVENHPAMDLLYRVNRFQTFLDHMWLSQQYLELTGEAPWFIDRGENGNGEPQNIMLLRPDLLTIKQSKDKDKSAPIAKYIYKQEDGSTLEFEPSELVFLKYPDPVNPFRGKGTLQAAARTFDIDNYAEEYNARFFYNSARPDSVLTTEQSLTDRQRKALRADISSLYRGPKNSQKVAILEKGLDWKPWSVSPKDMDFMAQQAFSRDKIFSIFRVPKVIVSITDDVNLANAKIAEYVFAKYTVKPKLNRIVSQLNEFYLPMFKGTEGMFMSFEDPVPADIELNIKRYDSALSKGYMTHNEVRAELNLEDVGAAGDVLYVPSANQEIGKEPNPLQLFSIKVPKNKRLISGIIERSAGGYTAALKRTKLLASRKKAVKELASKIDGMVQSEVSGYLKKRKEQERMEWDAKKAEFVDAYLKAAGSYQKAFENGMKMVFRKQKDKILAKLPQKKLKAMDTDRYQLDDADTEVVVRIFTPLENEIIRQQGERAARLAGAKSKFDLASKAVQKFLKERVFRFASEVNEETNKLLKNTLVEGVAAGEGVPALRKRVEEAFDGMEKYRAERIARSEVIRAANFASNEAYTQSDVVDKVQWLTAGDACQWCDPLDGKTIDLGGKFFKKGDKIEGTEGGVLDLSYESINYPPLHPNCRCTVVPIIK